MNDGAVFAGAVRPIEALEVTRCEKCNRDMPHRRHYIGTGKLAGQVKLMCVRYFMHGREEAFQ